MISTLMAFLGSKAGKLMAMVAVVLSLFAYVFSAGKESQEKDHKLQAVKDAAKTKERIADVKVSPDRDAAIDRLRDNGNLRD